MTLLKDIRLRIFLTSFLILFFELALIRFLPAEVYYLGYYSNFILIAAFVGMGAGMILGNRKFNLSVFVPWALLLTVGLSSVLSVSVIPTEGREIHFLSTLSGFTLPEIVAVPTVFILVTVFFIFLSCELGALFNKLTPLAAYTWDILGSLTGIAVFTIWNFLSAGPLVWFVLGSGVFLVLFFEKSRRWLVMAVGMGLAVGVVGMAAGDSLWSPYQKVAVKQIYSREGGELSPMGYEVYVNNVLHQTMLNDVNKIDAVYWFPYLSFNNSSYKEALIVGAGTGNDVVMALKHDVEHIDAVEIDPKIYEIGKVLNPNRPYDDPRVSVYVDDGRSFLEKTKKTYDLIIFALPDSLVLASGNSTVRLESFLFTKEAVLAAKRHLGPDGLLVMYNFYRQEWLLAKIGGTVGEVFGTPAYVDSAGAGRLFLAVVADGRKLADIKGPSVKTTFTTAPLPATDDWPFLYLLDRAIPAVYLKMLAVIGVFVLLLLSFSVGEWRPRRTSFEYFFLGVAFMLLETRSLIEFSLLFGNTWFVNSLVFFAILSLVFLAVQISERVKIKNILLWYIGLGLALVFEYHFRTSWLLTYTAAVKYVVISVITLVPIFFANIIFSFTFKGSEDNAFNFASNVLGAAVGGMLEYLALVIGYRNLLWVVIACYFFALVIPWIRRGGRLGAIGVK